MNKFNKKQILNFCYGFFTIALIFGLIYLWERNTSQSYYILTFISSIPLVLFGFALWAILINKNKSLAFGFLIGGILPFTYVFLLLKGCGIFG